MLKRNLKLILSVFFISLGLLLFSCTPKITQEQLMQLRELRKQERSLNEMLSKKRDEKSRLERELNSRKNELRDCESKSQIVRDRIARWPNIWPDWKYEEPKPAEPVAPTKKIRKK
ncbi:MAG: hypothetical protein N2517_05680 [Ignavibacteria bacterium]|nr:hypothetical protein [Ignavibacteria bacterium]